MKKLILLFLVLVLKFVPAKAQWVTIPDSNFVTRLTQLYPSCMNGNQMDTTCAGIVNATSLQVQYYAISNLFGVQYFDNLITLNCYGTQITSLPYLPDNLTQLNCEGNQLSSLPALPSSLTLLRCNNNQLTSLPDLPSSLTHLICNSNQLTSLPALPNSLTQLTCFYNQLSSLPNLPNSLTYLNCYNNQLSSLPNLPSSLTSLLCYFNQLSSLPALPNSLTNLQCNNNQLNSLPALSNSLTNLQCNNNQLSSLPTLPNTLTTLKCYNNLLSSLPAFPNTLTTLMCYNNLLSSLPVLPNSLTNLQCNENQLSSLPELPVNLTTLWCYYNLLSSLPALPNSLTNLVCNNNQLSSLPALPNSLTNLVCNNNQLSSLPAVPSVMSHFIINNNNISCLVNLPQVNNSNNVNISNNPLVCVPNQTLYSGSLPLCIDSDPINNPNNCPGVNITGNVYRDLNSNCSLNNSDFHIQNLPVKLYDSQNNFLAQSYTINGVYSFNTLLPDTFQVKIDTINFPIAVSCGQSSAQNVILTTASQTIQNINFPVICNAAYDVFVQSVIPQGWVFPGQIHTLKTNVTNNSNWYNLNCTSTTVSGTVSIQVNGPVSFVSPALGALTPAINGNTFTYSITDFNALTTESFGLYFITDTTAQANDQICVHVEISPNPIDADTINNIYDFCYNVVNSYDPNMKEVYPVDVLPGYDDWFTYTIHFQNTGNAPAFNIRLRDTLDTQLDLNTFEVLGYSHPANVGVSGNILTVRFNNIMLPDSTTDYEGSMGYFQYRLKPLPNLPLGSQISNTAYIYFDYNAPIITNTTANNFEFPVSVLSIVSSENSFSLFPNPSTGVFTFKDTKNLNTVEVYSILGEKILSQTNQKTINLNGFSKGVYFARVNGGLVLKLVKE
jgi:uncharacterized repeat protein (TIGR01451 family)